MAEVQIVENTLRAHAYQHLVQKINSDVKKLQMGYQPLRGTLSLKDSRVMWNQIRSKIIAKKK